MRALINRINPSLKENGEYINQYARQLYRVVQNFLMVAKLEVAATNYELIK